MHGHAPRHPNTDCGHLPPIGPHSRVPGIPPCLDAEVGQCADEHLLHGPDVGDDLAQVRQGHDGIADQLAGAVVGDVAAAVDVETLRADSGQSLLGDEEVGAVAVAAHGVDVGMFLQEQVIRPCPAGLPAFPEGALQVPGLVIREAAQPPGA